MLVLDGLTKLWLGTGEQFWRFRNEGTARARGSTDGPRRVIRLLLVRTRVGPTRLKYQTGDGMHVADLKPVAY
eukprot:SAG31_NODE_4126_length_3560_cov_2.073678_7_plen_73_part_00